MDKKITLSILAIVIIAAAVTILLPGGRQADPNPKLPWRITVNPDGSSSVFDLTLGQSTLAEAEQAFEQTPEVSLFQAQNGHIDIEAYFDRIFLSGLKANIVVRLAVEQDEAQRLFDEGSRISQMSDGSKKVTLNEAGKTQVANAAIELITYLPTANLEPELIEKHFGRAAESIQEGKHLTHWMYPERGLDIVINNEGKEVFQYVQPNDFNRLTEPLRNQTQ